MKILLFGKNGQVGWELHRSLQSLGDVTAFGSEEADFCQHESLRNIIRHESPDIIVNAAAYTLVDKAESEESIAMKINGIAVEVLSEEALKADALLVHYSTDYVFDGIKSEPYLESDIPGPVNAYGRTKLAGEQAIHSSGCEYIILRTSWVYSARGKNFLSSMLNLAMQRDELRVVSDQVGAPTSARLIAETTLICLLQVITERRQETFSSNLYHLTASGCTSWCGFANEIIKTAGKIQGMNLNVREAKAISTSEYPTPVQRPMNSRLNIALLEDTFGIKMPHWSNAISLCIDELKK